MTPFKPHQHVTLRPFVDLFGVDRPEVTNLSVDRVWWAAGTTFVAAHEIGDPESVFEAPADMFYAGGNLFGGS